MQISHRKRYTLVSEPKGATYTRLVEHCSSYSSSASLIVRNGLGISDRGQRLLDSLGPSVISSERRSEWPGTVLLSGDALVVTIQLDGSAVDALRLGADRLFGWIQPDLPEDLSFIRTDGSPFLVTICHESDAYLEADEFEVSQFKQQFPNVPLLEGTDL